MGDGRWGMGDGDAQARDGRWDAGRYRAVNIAKGGFHFAAAREVPRLMDQFENHQLAQYSMPLPHRTGNCAGACCRARRAGLDSSLPGRKWPLCTLACLIDGAAGRIAASRLYRLGRAKENGLYRSHPCRDGGRLRADVRIVQRCDPPLARPLRAARTLAAVLPAAAAPRFEKGSRMPSTAEDDLAETHRLALRTAGSRR
jgi:hypothetical protein